MNLNALVIDDSRTSRAIIIKTLRLTEFSWGELHEAADGCEALALLKRTSVDLIFTDLNMPQMDGFEMLERLAGDEKLSAIPVIVTSTEGNRGRIAELCAQGRRAFMRKPFTPEAACRALREVLAPDKL